MPIPVFLTVLFAAALHAGWNAIVKGGDDKRSASVMVATCSAVIAALLLPFLPQPARASWPFIAGSAVLQVGYFTLLAQAYRHADMSQAYPVMRGTAPLLVALASLLWLHTSLSPGAWAGIGLICAGVLGLAFDASRGGSRRGLALALLNAGVIASYTLVDGLGVRRSGAPAAYTLWIFLLTGLPLAGWMAFDHGRAFAGYLARRWPLGLVGGGGSLASYGLALWAMTLAPVAVVAALRETSILFATLLTVVVLREKTGPVRIAGACVIAAGAVVLRLA